MSIRYTRNLKGFVFTLDAVFALIVAAVGVSILLYVDFTNPASYASSTLQAYNILQNMIQTTTLSNYGGSPYLSALAVSYNGTAYSWPGFAHDGQLSSSTGFAPQTPLLLYQYSTGSQIIPGTAVASGIAAFAASNSIYMINASTGKLKSVFTANSASNIAEIPVIYRNYIVFANSSNGIVEFGISNLNRQWGFVASNPVTTPIEIENNYLAFGTSNGFYLLNALNGTAVAFGSTNAPSQVPLYTNGEYIASTDNLGSQNYLYSFSLGTNSLTITWNAPLTNSRTTQPVALNGNIAVGSGHYFYIFSLGGNQIFQTGDLGSSILGIAGYKNIYYVETSKNIYAFSNNGYILSIKGTATNLQNTTPSIGPGTLYTIINGNLFQSYSTSSNKMLWNIMLPSNSYNPGYSNIALAYGNMYVVNANTLYVFGTYKPQLSDSILETISNMYLNNQSDYSNILLNALYNSSTTGIYINNTYAPTLSVATFNSLASSYVEQANGFQWTNSNTQHYTISVWVNPNSNNGVIVDELGQQTPNQNWHYSIMELYNGNVYVRVPTLSCINLGHIASNSWSNIVLSYNGLYYKGYINGALAANGLGTRSVPGSNALMYYPLGVQDSNNCGSGAYFNGSILNYQLYNSTLGQSQIGQIYSNGAFGVPSIATNLYLPLDGNSNDFSGFFNLGYAHNIQYKPNQYISQRLANAYEISKAYVPMYLTYNGANKIYNVSVITWR